MAGRGGHRTRIRHIGGVEMKRHNHLTANDRRTEDRGFSLVEIVIAMLLLAVVAVAILPLIIGVTQLTVTNSDSVRAKALVQQKLASIQSDYPTNPSAQVVGLDVGLTRACADLVVGASDYAPSDSSITDFTLQTTTDACPAGFPATVPVHVKVLKGGTVVAEAHTSVRVTQ